MSIMSLLPEHGFIGCTRCYQGAESRTEFSDPRNGKRWALEQPNASWGSRDPRVLVLGFSRGSRQTAPGLSFDEIAFKGMRSNLTKILVKLGLLDEFDDVGRHIAKGEKDFAFGSLIRCSISQWDKKKDAFTKSGGSILQNCMKNRSTRDVAERCADTFLVSLPERTEIVVLLGNEAKYVHACFELIQKSRGEAERINSVAYRSKGVLFVHVIHAGAQGSLVPDWLNGLKSQRTNLQNALQAASTLIARATEDMRLPHF